MILLYLLTFEIPKFSRLAVVTYYGSIRWAADDFGKYSKKSRRSKHAIYRFSPAKFFPCSDH
jgi:hypothetical protein